MPPPCRRYSSGVPGTSSGPVPPAARRVGPAGPAGRGSRSKALSLAQGAVGPQAPRSISRKDLNLRSARFRRVRPPRAPPVVPPRYPVPSHLAPRRVKEVGGGFRDGGRAPAAGPLGSSRPRNPAEPRLPRGHDICRGAGPGKPGKVGKELLAVVLAGSLVRLGASHCAPPPQVCCSCNLGLPQVAALARVGRIANRANSEAPN